MESQFLIHFWFTDLGYPRKISDDWSGLPDNIDAAVTWTDNKKTYFFKDNQYWKFDNMQPVDGYPKDISVGFQVGLLNQDLCDVRFKLGAKIYLVKYVRVELCFSDFFSKIQ